MQDSKGRVTIQPTVPETSRVNSADGKTSKARPESVKSELTEIRRNLDAIALDQTCTDNSQCVSIAADDNGCGAPTEWLMFSTLAPRYKEVDALIRQSFQLDNVYPESGQQICGGPSKPELGCQEGQCRQLPFLP
nr:Unknown Function [uncultured bacterium]